MFIDPLAWQAVGRTRGWTDAKPKSIDAVMYGREGWKNRWHRFIDHLADRKTIDEALAAIEHV